MAAPPADLPFGELRNAIPGMTQHMLSTQLRELEADGLVSRTVFAGVRFGMISYN